MKSEPAIMQTCSPVDVAKGGKLARGENVHVGFAAGLAEGAHLIVKGLPVACET